jgi:general secretion pathway protein G
VVIILGILAAIVIPQFTNASTDARKSNLTSQLQTLRSQVQLFKLQHNDTAPDLSDAAWKYLTQCSTPTGTPSVTANTAGTMPTLSGGTVPDQTTFTQGPYLPSPAVNPLTNSSTTAIAAGVAVGWVYNPQTGEIHGVTADGNKTDDGTNTLP